MAKKIKQFRYYSEDNSNNSSGKADFVTGAVFKGCFPIVQIGIQSLPGTRFYLNSVGELNGENDSIIVGRTGIFELSLNQTKIYNIKFDAKSLDVIDKNQEAYLIVDILYEEEDN